MTIGEIVTTAYTGVATLRNSARMLLESNPALEGLVVLPKQFGGMLNFNESSGNWYIGLNTEVFSEDFILEDRSKRGSKPLGGICLKFSGPPPSWVEEGSMYPSVNDLVLQRVRSNRKGIFVGQFSVMSGRTLTLNMEACGYEDVQDIPIISVVEGLSKPPLTQEEAYEKNWGKDNGRYNSPVSRVGRFLNSL